MSMNSMSLDVPSEEELMKSPLAKFITFSANDCGQSGSAKDLIVNWVHPLFLKAKASASKEDNSPWWEAMHGPFVDKYWKTAITKVETLEAMNAWEVIDCTKYMNVPQSTWAFKLKRFPDGLIKTFKAWFCVPEKISRYRALISVKHMLVAQWTTICLMLI